MGLSWLRVLCRCFGEVAKVPQVWICLGEKADEGVREDGGGWGVEAK